MKKELLSRVKDIKTDKVKTISRDELFYEIIKERLSKPYKTISHQEMLDSLNIDTSKDI